MDLVSFTADSADEAIDKVRDELGPDAVIERVVKLPPKGVNRIWQKPRIQVFARSSATKPSKPPRPRKSEASGVNESPKPDSRGIDPDWAVAELLEASGMLPQFSLKTLDLVQSKVPSGTTLTVAQQVKWTKIVLRESWKPYAPTLRPTGTAGTHIFIGPPGSGKSTVMCKWMTLHKLLHNNPARAFQLNNERAHINSELLSVHCEILGLELEKFHPESSAPDERHEGWFVDLPGSDLFNPDSLANLLKVLREFSNPQVHLVLNLAYESPVFMGQMLSCFKANVPVTSLILTHLDEEARWGKIWNLAFASSVPVSHFSNGQNIPGDFLRADPDLVMRQQFPS